MAQSKLNGGPAFPCAQEHQQGMNGIGGAGMTLRDWFAGQALAGYFAAPNTPHRGADDCAAYMYQVADAMIAERSK